VRPDIWRFGLQLPLVLIMLVLTAPRLYQRWQQPAIQVAAPLFARRPLRKSLQLIAWAAAP
jgi:hypothetical protein